MEKKFDLHKMIYLFFVTSMLGWVGEVFFQLLIHQKWVNPGTLCGMWCPIYGVASILMALFLKKDDKLLKNFLSIVVISLVVEYVSAYISEEFFHHRLWDYSHMFLNFEGRICFSMGILFGLVGLFFFYLLLPILYRLYQKHTKGCRYLNVIFIILFFINILIECII